MSRTSFARVAATAVLAAVVSATASLVAPRPCAADDVLVLQNGREIRGRVVEDRPDAVKIDIGGGKMTFRRDQIREVRLERAAEAAGGTAGEPTELGTDPAARREETAVLYVDGERAGTRTVRATRLPDGFLFEEEIRLVDAAGAQRLELRTTERDDLQFRPLTFQVRETDAAGTPRTFSGEVRGGRVHLTYAKGGEKEKREVPAGDDVRFPFAAREMFLRETKALGGRFAATVFDFRDATLREITYREGGVRPIRVEDRETEARIVVRRRGDRTEREWIGPDGTAVLAELDGPAMLAVATTRKQAARPDDGAAPRAAAAGSFARMRHVDPVGGWRIDKPDATWTFERAGAAASGVVLAVRNEPLSASVEVSTDLSSQRTKVEDAAEAFERSCRAASPDFEVVKDGWLDRDGLRSWRIEATATTDGRPMRTLARVIVRDGRAWRLVATAPAAGFEALRAELESVLDSFVVAARPADK